MNKGDRVAMHLPNCPQYVIAYFAVLHLGAIVVNLNPQYTPNELKHIVEDTRPKLIFSFDGAMAPLRALMELVEPFMVVVTGLMDYAPETPDAAPQELDLPDGWLSFSRLLADAPSSRPPRVVVRSQDPAVIIYTGGTTGTPKGAVLTHGNYVASFTAAGLWFESTLRMIPVERRAVMTVLPLFHVYAQICCLHYAVFNAATMILVPRFEVDRFMDTLARVPEISFFPAVATLINAVVNHPRAAQLGLNRKIKLLNGGGGPMPLSLIEQVEELGISYSEGWGMTETTSMGASNPAVGLKKHGSIGIPLVGADIKLVDLESGENEAPLGEPGEIVIKAPYVMSGYWNNPRGDGQTAQGRLAPHRRHRGQGRRWLHLYRGPQKGHDHRRRIQHLPPRDRRGPLPAPQGFRGDLPGRARSLPWRDGEGLRGAQAGRERRRAGDHRLLPGAAHRLQGAQDHRVQGLAPQVGGGQAVAQGAPG